MAQSNDQPIHAEQLARMIHEAGASIAPQFGLPNIAAWEMLRDNERKMLCAVSRIVLHELSTGRGSTVGF